MLGHLSEGGSDGDPKEGLICTLFEGEFHFGAAALVNSLVRHGYLGCIVAGYRGALPPWLDQLKPLDGKGSYEVCPGVRIDFILQDTPMHFTYFKPQFLLQLFGERRSCKYIYYFDPDIVNAVMPENHPRRCEWREMVAPLGLGNPRPLHSYYNGGFIGLPTNCSGFLHRWEEATQLAISRGLDVRGFAKGDRTNPF